MAVSHGYEFYCESQNIEGNYSMVRLKYWIDVSGSSWNGNWQTGTIWFRKWCNRIPFLSIATKFKNNDL